MRLLILGLLPFCLGAAPPSDIVEGKVNYPSNFQVDKGWDLFAFGEYLYWIAEEDGLYFSQTGVTPLEGKLKKVHPHWESGARIGLGLNFPRAGYDAAFYWTWFGANSHGSSHAHAQLPLWAEPDFSPQAPATHARAHWRLKLNVFDVEWGRSSWFGGHFSLRPFFGIRGALIGQEVTTRYTYDTVPTVLGHYRNHAGFHGAGLRAGVDARFDLPFSFAVYGLGSGSLLYGRANADMRMKEKGFLIADTKDHFWRTTPSLQLGLGLGWDTHFAKDRLHIEFHAGWESNLWFGVNQMNHFTNQLSQGAYFKENGNLSTQGLVAGGRFDF